MKKLSLSLTVIVSFVLFSLFGKKTIAQPLTLSPVPGGPPATGSNTTPDPATPAPVATAVPVPSVPGTKVTAVPPAPAPAGYKDGSYTGSAADAFYGTIQVKAVISGGQITDVQFLQYPSDRRTSIEINTQAMPYLRAEAIRAQSSQVDIVSGATDSSLAFIQSLGSALSQAK